ncbi:ribonuclease H1 domain-containing protein [Wenyingzhuangia marina]|uniref:Ribonuclease H n=1 Tax=Wenyingzhuangia marina TaxID=1195760 RepID=A0A1M5SY49_9FLAO|nr:ribonuclease H family protein [Wenyingzhuangia marina]GGF64568.1 ribonuclease H [Wenyingzhuangia marina]SHH43238.1 ribonuclease HI [Wenyingzhuangia marina]
MAKNKKYYVVWNGKTKGVFNNWNDCKKNIDGFQGAQYKSFTSKEEAELAFTKTYEEYKGKDTKKPVIDKELLAKIGQPNLTSISVDAACSGNPGLMEYRGVNTKTKQQLFIQGPFKEGTNNIGEFLALVHGLAYLQKINQPTLPIYSDSRTAIAWVKAKQCRTKIMPNPENKTLFDLIKRGEKWLQENTFKNPIIKWETKVWGEIPADFGRK